jgi:ABC-type transport system substrate-binding protein
VGSGPFKLEKLVPRQQLILDKNPDYWNKDRIPRVDKVVLIPLPEANARTAALLSKQVDWIEAPAPDAVDQIKLRVLKSTPTPSRTCGRGSSPLKKARRGKIFACAKPPTCA